MGKYPSEVSLCAFLGLRLFQRPLLGGGFSGPWPALVKLFLVILY